MICHMGCVNAFFIDITNIFVNMTVFSCHFNQKDTLRIPNECLRVILTLLLFFAVWELRYYVDYFRMKCVSTIIIL